MNEDSLVEGFGVCGARLSPGQAARLDPSTTAFGSGPPPHR